MAPPDRSPSQHLSFAAAAAPEAHRWEVFALLRRLEALAHRLPRIGRSRLPAQDVVDLSQTPSLGFAPRTIERIAIERGRPRVEGYWLGLLGPQGPMPIHVTEYAHYEATYAAKRPFGRFIDLVSGRMLQFFYRAWADSQPAAQLDRPAQDRFSAYVGHLSGADAGVGADSAFPARARLHYAGIFASRRSAGGLRDALSHLLRQDVDLLEYQPRWQRLELADQSRLGRAFCQPGIDAVAGSQVRMVTDAFRIVIAARSWDEYQTLLPTGDRFALAAEAIDAFAPGHLEWDLMVEIPAEAIRPARLGGAEPQTAQGRLGWSAWVGKDGRARRRDAHLTRAGGRHLRRPAPDRTHSDPAQGNPGQ